MMLRPSMLEMKCRGLARVERGDGVTIRIPEVVVPGFEHRPEKTGEQEFDVLAGVPAGLALDTDRGGICRGAGNSANNRRFDSGGVPTSLGCLRKKPVVKGRVEALTISSM